MDLIYTNAKRVDQGVLKAYGFCPNMSCGHFILQNYKNFGRYEIESIAAYIVSDDFFLLCGFGTAAGRTAGYLRAGGNGGRQTSEGS